MEALVREKGSIQLRKIDIKTWRSDVAQQYSVRSIPRLMLYDGMSLIADDTAKVLDILRQ